MVSGRKLADMPPHQAVMDLRVLVQQMQTDAFEWPTLHFITERRSINLVKEAKQAAAPARGLQPPTAPPAAAALQACAAQVEDDGPPPLEDDGPPPLE